MRSPFIFCLLLVFSSAVSIVDHVIIIGCDGFGGMYLENSTDILPNIASLIQTGSYTTRARDQHPSVSAPNWSTIITGMRVPEHGVVSNSWIPPDDHPVNSTVTDQLPPISGEGKIPQTMWRVAKEQSNLTVAVSISWDWINYLAETGIVDFIFRGNENDDNVATNMAQFIQNDKPNLMFVHFDDIDETGHAYGWGSPQYYKAAQNVDTNIGKIISAFKAAKLEALVIITADHGGWRFTHGMFNEANMYIPAIFNGPGVKQNFKLTQYIDNADFAPTALFALGLKPGTFMSGRIVEEIFQ